MLVLSRRVGEEILIGADVRVTALQIGSNRVQLGIDAPSGVSIFRQELYRRICAEKAQSPPGDELPSTNGA